MKEVLRFDCFQVLIAIVSLPRSCRSLVVPAVVLALSRQGASIATQASQNVLKTMN
jgi:hypothetical protein